MSASKLTVAELMATIGQVAEGASEKKELLDLLQVISQAATDIVDLLEKQRPAAAASLDVDALAKTLAKAIAAIRIPPPQVTVQGAAGNDWRTMEIEPVRDITGVSKYVITRKN